MNKQVLKGLVLTLKALVEELESEIFSDTDSYKIVEQRKLEKYDEMFEDDDGYCD